MGLSLLILIMIGVYGLVKLEFHPFITQETEGIFQVVYHDTVYNFTIKPYDTLDSVLRQLDLKEDVEMDKINPSQIIKDGDKYILPLKTATVCIHINTADYDQLILLKGVGDKMAQRIIAYRDMYGLFQTLEDLMEVKGIGPKVFEKMKDQLCI